ncbi:DNA-binding protein [Massilia scottii]|uniref:DNA-binding protein n=1 Tax=Massilia scottii TaxID=3057166 RepID=UPI002796C8FE|nr:DNA-binding protein [Massilia sp. CCM 9029]MDQ1835189.1 DNA-binding protein [Massilia sp. CCM 9029]
MQPAATPKVTFEAVAAAAEALSDAGKKASVRNVKDALGGGSPNAILPHLQAWKAGRPGVRVADVALDGRIVTILSEQITAAVVDATKATEARAGDLEADLEAVAEAGRLAETRAAELADELAHSQSDQQQQAGRLDALAEELERLKLDAAAAVAEARADAAREREAGEQVRQALVRAELRLEAVPGMESALVDLRGQLDAERTARVEAEKAAAVAVAERHAAETRAGDLRESLEHARSELRIQVAQLTMAQAEAGEARQAAAVAREEAASLRGQAMQQSGVDHPVPPPKAVPVTTKSKMTTTKPKTE